MVEHSGSYLEVNPQGLRYTQSGFVLFSVVVSRKELRKARAASPLGRGLPQEEPGRRPAVAGARGSWRPEAAPKNTARRVCGTRPQMRHAERARKPSSFLKSVHYNKSYAAETPMQSIEFTAIHVTVT